MLGAGRQILARRRRVNLIVEGGRNRLLNDNKAVAGGLVAGIACSRQPIEGRYELDTVLRFECLGEFGQFPSAKCCNLGEFNTDLKLLYPRPQLDFP
jgi:hypothetical protein